MRAKALWVTCDWTLCGEGLLSDPCVRVSEPWTCLGLWLSQEYCPPLAVR